MNHEEFDIMNHEESDIMNKVLYYLINKYPDLSLENLITEIQNILSEYFYDDLETDIYNNPTIENFKKIKIRHLLESLKNILQELPPSKMDSSHENSSNFKHSLKVHFNPIISDKLFSLYSLKTTIESLIPMIKNSDKTSNLNCLLNNIKKELKRYDQAQYLNNQPPTAPITDPNDPRNLY